MFLFSGAILCFLGCEKNEIASDAPVTSVQSQEPVYALAELLIDDRKNGGELAQKQIELFHKTGVEEFMLVDFTEEGVGLRTPSVVQNLLAQNPLMEIAYPSYAFFESTETFEQHIGRIQYFVVLESGTDPESASVTTLPAYDASGNAVQIANTFDESVRYAVVAMDEAHDAVVNDAGTTVKGRTKPTSLSTFTPSSVVGNVKYYEEATIKNARFKDLGSQGAGSVNPVNLFPPVCDRPVDKKDQLYKIRFSDKDAVKVIEAGFRLPRVELDITYGIVTVASNGTASTLQLTTQVDKKWKDMDGSSWSGVDAINQQIKTWDGNDADTWGVLFVEDDGGSSTSFTFGVTPKYTVDKVWEFATPVSFTVPTQNNDDIAGNIIIEYCDPAEGEGTSYKIYTGGNDGMYFRENLQQQ